MFHLKHKSIFCIVFFFRFRFSIPTISYDLWLKDHIDPTTYFFYAANWLRNRRYFWHESVAENIFNLTTVNNSEKLADLTKFCAPLIIFPVGFEEEANINLNQDIGTYVIMITPTVHRYSASIGCKPNEQAPKRK